VSKLILKRLVVIFESKSETFAFGHFRLGFASMAANIKVDEIAPLVTRLRSNWRKGKTRSVEWRRTQLNQISKMMTEHRDEVSFLIYLFPI
jgi:hypothetical protein